MKVIQQILGAIDKLDSIVAIIQAFLAGVETFNTRLKEYNERTKVA